MKAASILFAGLLATASFFAFDTKQKEVIVVESPEEISAENLTTNLFELNQYDLQLNHEVVQYEIKFQQNDTVNISMGMFVRYIDETIVSEYFLLTDGEKPLMEPRSLWYVPERKYSIVTPRIRLSIGRFWIVKLLNDKEGKVQVGSGYKESKDFDVHVGDIWHLTFAVPTSAVKSGFLVTLKSSKSSMKVNQTIRHGNVGLYSATYNQFDGKYYSLKLSLLGGFSVCNVSKEISVKDGSIVSMFVAGHRKGSVAVSLPNGEKEQRDTKGSIMYSYLGNETGTWKFEVKGWSLYFRIQVVLLYIDIDPHIRYV